MRPKSDFFPVLQSEAEAYPLRNDGRFCLSVAGAEPGKKPYIFSIMRKPVSWVESWYRYRARDQLAPPDHPQHQNYTGHLSFPEYMEAVLEWRPRSYAQIHSQFS